MARKLIIFIIRIGLRIISQIRIVGIENVPDDSPIIVTSNHIGFLDGIMIPSVPMLSSHPNLIVVIAEKYGKKPFLKWVINILGFIFIDRYNPDIRTVREVIKRLKMNGFMIIAPEGTRSPNGSLIEGKPGAAYLAAKTNATILPISLLGCEDSTLRTRLLKLKRLDINVHVGKPYNIPKLPRGNREEFLQKYTDEIMCRIAALLPPSRHGFYSEHPRIKELLISENNE